MPKPQTGRRVDLQPLSQRIIEVILAIPRGKVASYGLVAQMAGRPGAARQVSRILHACSAGYDLPWHRVINARGRISLAGEGADLQRALLEAEGIRFGADGTIDQDRVLGQGAARRRR